MQQALQQVFASYLLNAAWQIPVVAVCALGVSRFAGLSARARNGLWLMALAAAVILPAVSLASLVPHATPTVALGAPGAAIASAGAAAAPGTVAAAMPAIELPPWLGLLMSGLVLALAAALAARLVAASRAARRLVAQSQPASLPATVAKAVDELARAHGRSVPPVRRSAGVAGPAVVGALSPVILVPDGLNASDEELRAALLHEMAHVVRHDYAVNLACELFTLPVSWHPALAGIKAGVRHSRELACDAMAAQAMTSQKTYAKCLVSLAQSLGAATQAASPAPSGAALAVGLFGRSDLEDRLMHLMKPRDAEGPVVRTARACGLAALGAGLLGSAALLHVTPVLAQSQAPPAAVQAAQQAEHDAAKPDPAPAPHAVVTSRKGIIITSRHASHRHTWTAADGQSMTVVNDDPAELTPEEQRRLEATVRDAEAKAAQAEAKAADVEARVNSPEFKAKIAAAEARGAEAEARVNSPEFKARIAQAEARAADAQRMIDSPEFKARIAAAQARATEAEKRINSPEFKARIAQAQARGEAAARMVNSPEFKAKIARAEAAARRAARETRDIEVDIEPDAAP
jgi:beta-lactamase regulating signal transducer with metallopeptidase domain